MTGRKRTGAYPVGKSGRSRIGRAPSRCSASRWARSTNRREL